MIRVVKHAALDTGRLKGLTLLLALAAAVSVASLLNGGSGISARQAIAALLGAGDEAARSVMIDVRLPRLLAAFGVGGLLALAGVLLQALYRNPLADPYVMGVSGGAAVGALLAMIAGAAATGVQGAAIAGALGAVALVYALARGGGTSRLLLTGVVIASASGALVLVLVVLAADTGRVRGMVFWLAGDLGWALSPWSSVVTAIVAAGLALLVARPLNVLSAGELRARSVGLQIEVWRTTLFITCATLTAVAVISAGSVGFVGLITPHAIRLAFRTSDHRVVAPASVVLGGTILAAADLLARTLASPRQLPVGAIMALVGAPLFIILLRGRSAASRLM
jgi:iron complex transport system permease protein